MLAPLSYCIFHVYYNVCYNIYVSKWLLATEKGELVCVYLGKDTTDPVLLNVIGAKNYFFMKFGGTSTLKRQVIHLICDDAKNHLEPKSLFSPE